MHDMLRSRVAWRNCAQSGSSRAGIFETIAPFSNQVTAPSATNYKGGSDGEEGQQEEIGGSRQGGRQEEVENSRQGGKQQEEIQGARQCCEPQKVEGPCESDRSQVEVGETAEAGKGQEARPHRRSCAGCSSRLQARPDCRDGSEDASRRKAQ